MKQGDIPYAFAYNPHKPSEETPIGKCEYQRIKESTQHIYDVQEIEDLYEMLVKAVWKFDQIFFQHADLERFENGDFNESFYRRRQEINNVSVEVFSILQMFLDYQADNPHVKAEPLPKLADEPAIQKCKALRNYLQHVGTFPLVISTRNMICAQAVDFSSIRFTMTRDDFDLERLNPKTRQSFESAFPVGADIDLYEIVSRGFDAVSKFLTSVRCLVFFSNEYEECSVFLKAFAERTWNKGLVFIRYADGRKVDGKDNLLPYLADANMQRIEILRKRYKCRPISQVYVTNAPDGFLTECNRQFFNDEARAKRFSQIMRHQQAGSASTGNQPANANGTTP